MRVAPNKVVMKTRDICFPSAMALMQHYKNKVELLRLASSYIFADGFMAAGCDSSVLHLAEFKTRYIPPTSFCVTYRNFFC